MTLEDVIKKVDESPQNKNWVSEYKTRLKLIIKQNKLTDKAIKYLWAEVTLRRPIVKSQKLPEDLIHEIIDLTLNNKKRFISSSVYKETLMNQTIKDEEIQTIWNVGINQHRLDDVVTMVKIKTQQLIDIIGFRAIVDTIVNPGYIALEHVVSVCAAIAQHDQSYISDISQKFFDLKDIGWIYHSMSTLAKISYFEDDLVDRLYQHTDEMSFYQILQVLMSRNHCSSIVQAKYLLNK